MVTLHSDTRLVDLAGRLPFAFVADYLIGPAWDYFPWPTSDLYGKNDTADGSTGFGTPSGIAESGLLYAAFLAGGYRLLIVTGTFFSWLVIKFWPSSQMILLAVWMEAVVMSAAIIVLSWTSVYTTLPIAACLTIGINFLHSLMLTNLRQLRILELMGLPPSVLDESFRTSGIGDTFPIYIWPKLPFLLLLCRSCYEMSDTTRYIAASLLLVAFLPAVWLIIDGFRWRIWRTLYARSNGEYRLSVLTPYYFTIDAFHWPSINENMVNKVYAFVWSARVFYGATTALLVPGSPSHKSLVEIGTAAVVAATAGSSIANYGACWVTASVAHRALTVWLKMIGVTFTPTEEREHALVLYDMSGILTALSFMADVTNPGTHLTAEHIMRILVFFGLASLAEIPQQAGLSAQRAAMDGRSGLNPYAKAVFEGSLIPMGISYYLLQRMWKAPSGLEQIFSATWLSDRTVLLSNEFEIWMHGEAILCYIDLMVHGGSAIINMIGSHAHLVARQSRRIWHTILQKADWMQKLWTMLIREVLGVLLHSVVLSLLWENRLDAFVITVIYLARLMSNMEELHTCSVEGLGAQFFCWSRCMIRALPSPTEEVFSEWNDKCSVCQEEETERLQICVFPCGHFFHRECIEEWLKQRMCCPLCMRRIWFENGEVKIDK